MPELLDRVIAIKQAHDQRVEVLHDRISAALVESAEFRMMAEVATRDYERVSEENMRLRRELQHQRELTALPWWAKGRRRKLTMPMIPLGTEQ